MDENPNMDRFMDNENSRMIPFERSLLILVLTELVVKPTEDPICL